MYSQCLFITSTNALLFPLQILFAKIPHVHGEWIMTYRVFRIEWLTLSKPQLLIMIKVRVINSAYQSELGAIVCPPRTVTDK